jgi:hypothetical protein
VKMAVFWVVVQCSVVKVFRRFRGDCCLHHQGEENSSGLAFDGRFVWFIESSLWEGFSKCCAF